MAYPVTKWDLSTPEDMEWMLKTKCDLQCAGCGITLATEADFAKHFIVTDRTYPNLGHCPNEMLKNTTPLATLNTRKDSNG